MSRIRTVKPEFFAHEGLFDLEQETKFPIRVAFAGLWTQCDRQGRFKWRPRQLKTAILPYDECDFSQLLEALASRGFIMRYEANGDLFGYVPTWNKHQFINNKEAESYLPEPPKDEWIDTCGTCNSRVDDACGTVGDKERKGRGCGERVGNPNGMEGNLKTLSSTSLTQSPPAASPTPPLDDDPQDPPVDDDDPDLAPQAGKKKPQHSDDERRLVRQVFDFYVQKVGLNPARCHLTQARAEKAYTRLGFCMKLAKGDAQTALNLMCEAVAGLVANDWLMGRDPKTNGKRWVDFEKYVFGSDEVMEKRWDDYRRARGR